MKPQKKKTGLVQIIALAVFLIVSAVACLYLYQMYKNGNAKNFQELVASFGPWGVLFMLALQVLQVVFAIIPGEPVELAMGALYGAWFGCLICLAGIVLGTLIIFLLVKWLGGAFIEHLTDSEKFRKLKFLQNPAKRDVLIFLLMFIPGTPKDLLTYFAPFTGIPLGRFVILALVARIPSVISSTYVGQSFASGSYLKSIIIFAVVGIVSLGGILLYNHILEKKNAGQDPVASDSPR